MKLSIYTPDGREIIMYANRSATKYATFHFFCSEVHDYAERRVKLVKDASVRFIFNNQDCVAVKCQTLLLVKIKTKLQSHVLCILESAFS